MKPEKPKNLGFRKIYFNLDKILFLFFLIFLMIEFVWLPSNSWIAGLLLRQTGYLFLSYNNIFAIIKGSPFVSLALFILVIVNLLVAYYQIGLLFIGARHLLYHERRTLLEYSRKVFLQSFLFMKQVTISKMAFIFFYVMMLFPLIRKILKIYYLNKIVIPEFIVDYVEDKYWLVGIVVTILALLLYYISVRFMFALPQLFFEKKTVKEAVRYSLEKTKRQSWFYIWNLLWIIVKTYLFFILLLIPILVSQALMDGLTHKESLVLGIINFVLIKNFHYIALTYFLIKFVSFLYRGGTRNHTKEKERPLDERGSDGLCLYLFRS
ncbi:Glycerophosphoryl diester phosphodiesterase [Streptococcus mitis]|uniref:Glycerophosphoryl diester phosphodiesterase n=1 Tax=Streptococcus mitis TaxID=28037 RepID=A0A139PWD3_STRMT|nr:Glycerophosphoryl diester phosphodiesterase [Streptococcus mitis]